ncbi:hypothetical protein MFLO_01540 [Listeria floridensis FSL S10-1187]|uniref:Bacterial bifunctional deaminase-reductase C-terminal domain-containing protein n=1 Tax=Listeria floridensis FSL S10-1187 TaxID=1265817 RepID=A0ABN0RIV7_9LIST|nr:RibD family protein [Listeria floridensis]EUJ33866.1 hypothetical protein MFLO_01540 [Listeria floridensis FSL S10-1187]
MTRPYIFCHMQTSLDGKIIGNYMETPEGRAGSDWFYELAFGTNAHYKHQGWLSGRTTTDDNFTHYKKPNLPKNPPQVPDGDFIVPTRHTKYYISIDPSGKLGWETNTLTYRDTEAHVVEVLTDRASNAYKAFLREKQISYVLAGKSSLDAGLALEKLRDLFNLQLVMLGGGGVLNWSFIEQGLCDEVSVVISPAADGAAESPSLFETKAGLSGDAPVAFELQGAETNSSGAVWLRYLVKK